jgi:hypothetical protein
MHVPIYWRRELREARIDGKPYRLSAWGHSDTGPEEARADARQRLGRTRQILEGHLKPNAYEYYADALREVRLGIFDDEADPFAIITRNGYGSRVLNTARVMFVDIDVEEFCGGFWASLFGKKIDPKQQAVQRVEAWVHNNRSAGFRIYETPAGLRLLATDKLYDPESAETAQILERLGSDLLYRRLCRTQKCFRARLSAKPWRIELDRCPVRFPDETTEKIHRAWCDAYEAKARGYAACRFIKAVGKNAYVHEIDRVVTVHDREAGCGSQSPLA